MAVHHVTYIKDRLADHEPETFEPASDTRQAAVAVILRPAPDRHNATDILFIKRR